LNDLCKTSGGNKVIEKEADYGYVLLDLFSKSKV